jgi:hypothetical protein
MQIFILFRLDVGLRDDFAPALGLLPQECRGCCRCRSTRRSADAARRVCTSGIRSASAAACQSLSTITAGVFGGASNANQLVATKPG